MPTGSCLCSAVRFEVDGPLKRPDACHCTQCRKQSGHYWASTDVPNDRLTIHGAESITWYRSSERVERGFCRVCGSSLFWKPLQKDVMGVAMGAFDSPTGTRLAMHIFAADKGDYYDITDDLPVNAQ